MILYRKGWLFTFDVSPRIPGYPYVGPTFPEMRRLSLKYQWLMRQLRMERIAAPIDLHVLEIKYAAEKRFSIR